MKLWEKGYELNKKVEDFTVGNDYILDNKLVEPDCVASKAHARMLGKIGILTQEEVKILTGELDNIIKLHRVGKFQILKEHEDCHGAIEAHLVAHCGETGKKIHTGRSRNDQVLTALRLYCRHSLDECRKNVEELVRSVKGFAEKFSTVEIPGYTHLRKAMPSSVGMWSNALADSLTDDLKLLEVSRDLVNQSPLGTGAGYGIPLNLDRQMTADEMGFEKVMENPIYAQLSRGKFESTILHSLQQVMLDLDRTAADIIMFSMPEFGFFKLPDELCTGSSIMPQKKNPDLLELTRGYHGRVLSLEFQLKNIITNLPSGYQRDLQLTKEPLMQGFEITMNSLEIMKLLFEHLEVNVEKCREAMTDDLYATEKAYNLVKKGVSFREAYRKVAEEYM
jgi:argininosuccinate lyase